MFPDYQRVDNLEANAWFSDYWGAELDKKESSQQQLKRLVRGHIFITECLQPWFFFAFMETKHLSRSIKQLAKDNEAKSEIILLQIIHHGEQENQFTQSNSFLTSMMIKSLNQIASLKPELLR